MDRQEFEIAVETTMKAVDEQYIRPLALALGAIVAAIHVRDEEMSNAVADILRKQAESCRANDAVGWVYLAMLANLADVRASFDRSDLEKAVRTSLQLIQGGKKEPAVEDPDKERGN